MSVNLSGIVKSIRNIMRQDAIANSDLLYLYQLGWMLFFKVFSDKDKEHEILHDNYSSPIPPEFHWDAWAGNDEGMTGDELIRFIDQQLFPAMRNIDVSSGNKKAFILRDVFEGNFNYMKSGIHFRQVLNKLNQIDFNIAKDRHTFGEIYEQFLSNLPSASKTTGEFYTPRAVTQFMTDIVNPRLGEKVLDPACGTGGFLTATIEHLKKKAKNIEDRLMLQENVVGWEFKSLPYMLGITNLMIHDIENPNITYQDSLGREYTSYKERDRVDVILANPPFGGIVSDNNEKCFPLNYRTKESADLFLILMMHLLKHGGRAGIVLPDGSLTGEGVKQRIRQKLLEDCNLHTIIRLPNSVFQPYASVATNLLFFEKGRKTKEVWYYEHRMPESVKAYSKTKPIQLHEFEPIKKWWKKRQESETCWRVGIDAIIERGYDLDIKNPNRVEEETILTTSDILHQLSASIKRSDEILKSITNELK